MIYIQNIGKWSEIFSNSNNSASWTHTHSRARECSHTQTHTHTHTSTNSERVSNIIEVLILIYIPDDCKQECEQCYGNIIAQSTEAECQLLPCHALHYAILLTDVARWHTWQTVADTILHLNTSSLHQFYNPSGKSIRVIVPVCMCEGWGDYGTTVSIMITWEYHDFDYNYMHSECDRLQLHCKVIMITIMITMYITQTWMWLSIFTQLHF